MAALSRTVQEETLEAIGKALDTITVARVSFLNAKNEEIYWVRVECRSGELIEVKVPEKSDIQVC